MNTQTTVITEADVASFLRAQRDRLAPDAQFFFSAAVFPGCDGKFECSIYGHEVTNGRYEWLEGRAPTFEAALAALAASRPPTGKLLAEKKRAEAAALLAEAALLEGGAM